MILKYIILKGELTDSVVKLSAVRVIIVEISRSFNCQ